EDTLPGEEQNPIPYIEVGKDEESYPVLFISEYRETGEFEIDPEHGSSPVVEMDIHAYVNMNTLKEKLTPDILDQVRVAIGMQPLQQAQ
ncbi:MAG: hypothetical protein GWN01_09105, partial [Nitrosopumilaceae archaeon]|nr:hypothetical protein [Nitrosopumilaceae archaeon]NIU87507.1 hypothetical protein [Nitrosopumilaceae archaeon]NIV66153.1 hypothetical protein [Nitrosopumilaceae archaeon]NIX61666.1 hypothetical protein [Nitrosopumilaceae archaeon]